MLEDNPNLGSLNWSKAILINTSETGVTTSSGNVVILNHTVGVQPSAISELIEEPCRDGG